MLAPSSTDSAASRFNRILGLNYGRDKWRSDLLAGLTVAAISLPQAMAYALIAGVDPRFGLYSAIVVTAVAAIFGSSSHLINGPTNAISLVVFSALAIFDSSAHVEAYEAMFLLGVMIGVIQIFIAVFKLGDLTRYISESVILGFMTGAAPLIAIGQIFNFLGVHRLGSGDQQLLYRVWLTLTRGDAINAKAIAIGVATIALALALRRLVRVYKLPQMDMLAALVLVAVAVFLFGWSQPDLHGKTAVAVVGSVPASLPSPHIPEIKFDWVAQLSSSAFAIAVLGLVEALAVAKSIALLTRQQLDYNRQCLAEGLGNLVGGFFRCLPGSGSLTRSAINFQAGGATRFSGIVAAVTVAVAVVAFAPLTRYIPKAALAGLLMITAARLIDLPRLLYAFRASRYDAALIIITAATAVFVGVEYSIFAGVALSVLLFVPRASKLKGAELVVSPERVIRRRLPADAPCEGMVLFDLEGELFFGSAPELDRYLDGLNERATEQGSRLIVLRLRRVRNPDVVCLERLEHFLREAKKRGITVLLAGVQRDLLAAMKRLRFQDWFPADQVFAAEEGNSNSATLKAVRRAYELLGEGGARDDCGQTKTVESNPVSFYYLV